MVSERSQILKVTYCVIPKFTTSWKRQGRKTVVAGAGEGAVSTNQMHKERFKDHQRSHINAVWCPEANSRTLLEKLEI